MKDAHMSRGRELARSPPAEGSAPAAAMAGKEQIQLPFIGSRENAPALGQRPKDGQEGARG